MKSPTKAKEVQSLSGRIAALSRFISKSTNKCVPFFNILRGNKKFEWTEDCENAFQELKRQLAKSPVLSKPLDVEELGIYLAVTEHAVSAVLMREENNIQHPVYYISKRLVEAEGRYLLIEKLIYCLILAIRKLRPYFQAHHFRVYTDQPLHETLADFVVESTGKEENISKSNLELVQGPQPSNNEDKPTWKLHVDWSATDQLSGAGIALVTPGGQHLHGAVKFGFRASNNEAEYEALIASLKLARELHAEHIEIYSDSQLLVNHVSGEYEAWEEKMIAYLSKIHDLLAQFKSYVLKQIPREENTTADALTRLTSNNITDEANLIPIQFLEKPSITCTEEIEMIDTSPNWMTPIAAYLNTRELPSNRNEARKMRRKAARYIIVDGVMNRRGFSMSLLICVTQEEATQLLSEVHDGFCGNYAAGQSLSKKILRQGYF
ncbi:hypothetical protein CsatA_001143 [Cannabis sativa]